MSRRFGVRLILTPSQIVPAISTLFWMVVIFGFLGMVGFAFLKGYALKHGYYWPF